MLALSNIIIPNFLLLKLMWKNLMILPERRNIIPARYQISSLIFLSGLQPREFAGLTVQRLNQLVEHTALGHGPKIERS